MGKINVPSSWENQGFHGYDGYAWYRNSFKLSSDLNNKDIYLVLGYVDDVDQTFINGNLIGVSGGFPNDYRTAYNAFRKYYIPKEYLNKDGENTIALRIYDDELEGGIMSGKIGIYTYEGRFEPDVNLNGPWEFSIYDDSFFLKKKNGIKIS
ncbi:MAG: beta galactosidase jelly roll domain-containing protein [Ignavibacteriales bacterium]|nr:beta galactosidase jelly roll domain-containing protein [Ignavibacteriales bacterium]